MLHSVCLYYFPIQFQASVQIKVAGHANAPPPHSAFICVVICGSPVAQRFQMNAFLSAIIHCMSQGQAGLSRAVLAVCPGLRAPPAANTKEVYFREKMVFITINPLDI